MGDDSQRIHYHASRTVVNISGVLTTTTEDSGETVTERASEVTVGTSADPNAPLELVFKEHWGKDREFEIKLTADERLAGATAGTKGAGAQILGAALSLVPLVGSLVLPAMVAKKVTSVDEEFDAFDHELAERRKRFKKVIEQLQQTVMDEAGKAAGPQPPDLDRLKGLEAALALARGEAAEIETRFNAWRQERYPTWRRTLSYSLGTDELPRISAAAAARALGPDATIALDPDAAADADLALDPDGFGDMVRQAAEAFGVVVVCIEGEREQPPVPETREALLFRYPRPARLAVFEAVQPLTSKRFRLKSVSPASIHDSYSDWGTIAVKSGLFAEHGTGVGFGDEGTLVSISNKDIGAAGTIASVLAGAGAQIGDSLDQATSIKTTFPQALDPAMRSLQDQVTRKELEARLVKASKTVADS